MDGPPKTDAIDSLRESEERFRTTFAHASVGMSIATPEGRYLEVNRAFCEITGYTEAELLATDFQSITHPEDLPDRPRAPAVAGRSDPRGSSSRSDTSGRTVASSGCRTALLSHAIEPESPRPS